ncbi:MAG TPA: helix-turn-helix domain-containing protein [Fimbriiglobus sp.]|jgi:HTH-type transcriptional regulator/antitoxin HigA
MARKTGGTILGSVYGKGQDRYLDLILQFPLRPIRSDEELDDAIRVIDSLIDQNTLMDAEQDYLDVLGDLVEAYETETIPSKPATDAERLQFLIEIKGVTQAEVAKEAGIAVSTVSEVLSGKRKLNRRQIGKLAKYFHVGPGVFSFGE